MSALAAHGAALLGGSLVRAEPIGGGDLSSVMRIVLADGREAVVKDGPDPPAEAAMLRAIRATGAPAPDVLAVDATALVLERLAVSDDRGADADLGRAVARLHAATGARYGWAQDFAFGRVAIENGWSAEWPAFWAERRLLCHVPHCDPALGRRIESLAASLSKRLPARPRPALLHGDLWGGNVLCDGARVSGLIDPACSYGHAEVDLALLTLFGRPGPAFRDAYGPAEPGFSERVPLYQLWPALVHLRLFGAGYRGMVEGLLDAVGV
ncbi:fructosamine kinase family protein [Methylobacterium thuringiense]|uniref:Ketoamine kinase n=1 Tax=Methylobacterium thuringiense TaxID=1003091 RepID=A0ABQ4THN3_9HYPH|nr:fructosamine kinase family protein [Methylobacterium thuringiense]GJE54456.1 putative ketoamine kinase [Methylobacterium thuringiense]